MEFDAKEEIKSKLDIVDVISGYIQLQKAGANYKACCPFHEEKTPSFFVSPQRQMWHCFGCLKSGDIFTFVMEIENVDFLTALKILADKAGVKLPTYSGEKTSKNKVIYNIFSDVISLYHKNLKVNSEVKEYLYQRGLTDEIIDEFKLGFSSDDWSEALNYLNNKGYGLKDLIETGLFIEKNNSQNPSLVKNYYDRFRARIMFPIYNNSNEPVAFTGRIFQGKNELKTVKNIDETGKYVNSPQTVVYEKKKILYGLNITKKYIAKQNEAIIVEGTMDFLSAYMKDQKNIVASLGTALTVEQLTLLKRLCNKLILAYDNDDAGKFATERNIKLALSLGFDIKILDLEESKDISDFVNLFPDGLNEKIQNSLPVMDFFIKYGLSMYNTNNLSGKNTFLKYFLPKLKWEKDIIKISHYLNKITSILDIPLNVIEESFKQTVSEEISDVKTPIVKEKENINTLKSKSELISETILSVFVKKPIILKNIITENEEFFNSKFQNLILKIKELGIDVVNKSKEDDISSLVDYLFLNAIKHESLINKPDDIILEEISRLITMLKQEYYKYKIKLVENEIKNAESQNQPEKINELLDKLNNICDQLNKLQ